jgi:hypothetical protein
MQSVDHTQLHEAIVQKAFDVSSVFLTESQKEQLFKNKIERARTMLDAKSRMPVQTRTDS